MLYSISCACLNQSLASLPECIPPVVFKELADVLAEPLSIVLTRSFEDGDVPEFFRTSIVTPVHKKGSKAEVENYRPIAQESISCLIMEEIVADAITAHLTSHNLLDPHQHGFTKGRSTSTQLFEVAYDWALAKNHSNPLHCVYFDFSRAFDTVNHRILLAKMKSLGIGNRILRWCQAYLHRRSFCVKVAEKISASAQAPSGVPQGSCLGPLLYNIFAQDLMLLLGDSGVTYKLYADDLKLYREICNPGDRDTLQKAITLVENWAHRNCMTLSIPKCAVLKTVSDNTIYTLAGKPITEVKQFKDLGITFDATLKYRPHIAEVARSCARWCNMILRVFIIQDTRFYLKLYEALVVSKLLYCAHVWAPHLKKDVDFLQRVQDRFLKRVAQRCNVPQQTIALPPISEYHKLADIRMVQWLVKSNRIHNFFDISSNNLRSGYSVRPKEVALYDVVNGSLVWRAARYFQDKSNLCKILNLPFYFK